MEVLLRWKKSAEEEHPTLARIALLALEEFGMDKQTVTETIEEGPGPDMDDESSWKQLKKAAQGYGIEIDVVHLHRGEHMMRITKDA